VKELMSLKGLIWGVILIGVTVLISGCVTRETYESQVKRSTNLQRLLADEEKKRNVDVRRYKTLVRDLETQNLELEDHNRGLSAQVAALQDEEARMEEEMGFLQLQPTSVPDIEDFTIDMDDIESFPPLESFEVPDMAIAGDEIPDMAIAGDEIPDMAAVGEEDFLGTMEQPIYYELEQGDTLYSLARRYNTTVNELRELNGLTEKNDRNLSLGQRLIVGYQ